SHLHGRPRLLPGALPAAAAPPGPGRPPLGGQPVAGFDLPPDGDGDVCASVPALRLPARTGTEVLAPGDDCGAKMHRALYRDRAARAVRGAEPPSGRIALEHRESPTRRQRSYSAEVRRKSVLRGGGGALV